MDTWISRATGDWYSRHRARFEGVALIGAHPEHLESSRLDGLLMNPCFILEYIRVLVAGAFALPCSPCIMVGLVPLLLIVPSKLLFASFVALAFKGVLWVLNLLVLAPFSDPLRRLPGPRAGYWENHFWELTE